MKSVFKYFLHTFVALIIITSCNGQQKKPSKNKNEKIMTTGTEVATFANGCFWCTEAVFQEVEGVLKVESGYTAGKVANPTYEAVCTGLTGHAECLQITYDPKRVSFEDLLEVFWGTHDPTTLNRQGNDVGTQYRSGIYYHNQEQKTKAEAYKKQLEDAHTFKDPIVTEILPFTIFYSAEGYHQNYFKEHPEQGYCAMVIRPKVEKFRKHFKEKLKH